MHSYLEITGIKYVTGKDEIGDNLLLTRASYKKYNKDDQGNLLQDGQDAGEKLFVGAQTGEPLVVLFEGENLPEANITVFITDGVVAEDTTKVA